MLFCGHVDKKLCQSAPVQLFLSGTWSPVLSQIPGLFELNYVHLL